MDKRTAVIRFENTQDPPISVYPGTPRDIAKALMSHNRTSPADSIRVIPLGGSVVRDLGTPLTSEELAEVAAWLIILKEVRK